MPTLTEKRLAVLLEKERAHDDYLAATRIIRRRKARIDLLLKSELPPSVPLPTDPAQAYVAGYGQCLRDFASAIVEAANARQDAGL